MTNKRPCAEWAEMLAISHPEEDLSPLEYAALEEHIAHCPGCSAIRERYGFIIGRVRALSTDVPLRHRAPQPIDHEKIRRIAEGRRYMVPPYTPLHHRQMAPNASPRSVGRIVNAAFAMLVVAGLIISALRVFQHPPTTTTGGANATATALATAIDRASSPQDIYQVLTSSSPIFSDSLSNQDTNRWGEYTTTSGGCKLTGGAYHSYVLQPYVAECYAQAKSFPQTTIFALQVQMTLIEGNGGGGLIFGYRGRNLRYYRFVLRSDGYFDLYDPWTQRQLPYGTNPAFKSNPGQSHQLTVIVRNSIIYLYIDGIYVGQAPMEADTSVAGEIGLFSVDGQQNPTEVEFRNMKVWAIR